MEENWTNRTELLIGKKAQDKLKKAKVAVYGLGGVGSFVVEGLVRAGIGHILLIDQDIITKTNINRQIHANEKTIGKRKIDVMKQRILDINAKAIVETYMAQEIKQGEENLINQSLSYVVDAVDIIDTKIKLIQKSYQMQVPILSSMGTGNKLDPTKFEIATIENTSVCPLAKIIRKELKKRNISKIKVLYSKEQPKITKEKRTLGSISFVPSVAGLIIAGEVIKDIIKES